MEPPLDFAKTLDDLIDRIYDGKTRKVRTIGLVVVSGILAVGLVLWLVW